MRIAIVGALAVTLVATVATVVTTSHQTPNHTVTDADMTRWKAELSNWGRWGKDDEMGALNLITPAKRKRAAALVTEGFSVSLAHEMETGRTADNENPLEHTMNPLTPRASATDRIAIAFHGTFNTHLDALVHGNPSVSNSRLYNGVDRDEVASPAGASKFSIYNVKSGIFTRGVLIDIPRLKGVPYLAPGTPVYVEDLEAWEKKARVKVSAGDALFVRTGRWAYRAAVGPDKALEYGGLHASVIPWLRQRDIAVLASDVPQDPRPTTPILTMSVPVHHFALVMLGVHLFDNCDLEALGDAAAARNRWEFLLTAAPLAIRRGTGSPINPIATF